jgi:hypothetical protein
MIAVAWTYTGLNPEEIEAGSRVCIRAQMLAAIATGNSELDWSSLANTAIRNAELTPKRRTKS